MQTMQRPPYYSNENSTYTGELPPHVMFNKRANHITTGNAYTNVQSSTYIRPRKETQCNGFTFQPKHLQQADLKIFQYTYREMDAVRHYVEKTAFFEENTAIAYRFFHTDGQRHVVHGVIITDANYRLVRRFDRSDLWLPYSAKSAAILDFCEQFVTLPKPAMTAH